MFDLNIEVINNNNLISSHNNEKENSDTKEDENSATNNSELSGTSSASSLVNATTIAADESPISGANEFDFFSNNAESTCVTRQLFPMNDVDNDVRSFEYGDNGRREMELLRLGSSSSSSRSSSSSNQWLNLSVLGSGPGPGPGPEESNVKQQVRKSRRGPRSRSSQYRGVTFYRRTGRWESHIWDCGKQVYLGGFDTAHAAARAYDRAAIKFRGVDADINFTIGDYDEDMKQMKNLSKEEFVHILRRQSTGFSRGSTRYRGVTLHKCGRWESTMGQFLGKKAYDKAAIQYNGREPVTNFDPSSYDGQIPIMQVNNEGDGQNLDLNLGISITIDGPKRSHDKDVGESQLQHPALHLTSGNDSLTFSTDQFHKNKNGSSGYYSSGAPPLYGQPLASGQSPTMWSGLPPGWSAPYEHGKFGDPKLDQTIQASARIPNWASYMQNQDQGGSNGVGVGVGVGGTANQVPLLSTAASSGFSSFSTTTPSSTTYPFANYHSDFHNQGRGR